MADVLRSGCGSFQAGDEEEATALRTMVVLVCPVEEAMSSWKDVTPSTEAAAEVRVLITEPTGVSELEAAMPMSVLVNVAVEMLGEVRVTSNVTCGVEALGVCRAEIRFKSHTAVPKLLTCEVAIDSLPRYADH